MRNNNSEESRTAVVAFALPQCRGPPQNDHSP